MEIVKYMYSWLESEITRLGKIASKGKGISYGHSWLLGCANGIRAQFEDIRRGERLATNGGGTTSAALTLLNNRAQLAREHLGGAIRTASRIGGGRNNDGMASGFSTGRSMQIRQGLNAGGGGGKTNILGS